MEFHDVILLFLVVVIGDKLYIIRDVTYMPTSKTCSTILYLSNSIPILDDYPMCWFPLEASFGKIQVNHVFRKK